MTTLRPPVAVQATVPGVFPVAVVETSYFNAIGYHAKCLTPGCGWVSRGVDHERQALAFAKAHGQKHARAFDRAQATK